MLSVEFHGEAESDWVLQRAESDVHEKTAAALFAHHVLGLDVPTRHAGHSKRVPP